MLSMGFGIDQLVKAYLVAAVRQANALMGV